MYIRNKDNIIEGNNDIEIINNKKQAVILLHGFGDTPQSYHYILDNFKKQDKFDIYAPLLLYHGRNLQEMNAFDPNILFNKITDKVAKNTKK